MEAIRSSAARYTFIYETVVLIYFVTHSLNEYMLGVEIKIIGVKPMDSGSVIGH